MKKNILHKYFRMETDENETNQMIDWVNESAKNQSSFLHERRLWNQELMSDKKEESIKRTLKPVLTRVIWKRVAGVAALLALLMTLFLNYYEGESAGKQTIVVPVGQRANLVLADGTSVWLNSNTTFSYPLEFNKHRREVTVDGEAYFEVASKKRCPFIVHTQKYDVEVLGTSFNLYAYSASKTFETTLYEGALKIRERTENTSVDVKPNEKVFSKNERLYKTRHIDGHYWTDGVLFFNDKPIKDVLEQLGTYYDKEIIWEGRDTTNYHCTAKFSYKDGLNYILKIISKDLPYEIVNDTINNKIVLK